MPHCVQLLAARPLIEWRQRRGSSCYGTPLWPWRVHDKHTGLSDNNSNNTIGTTTLQLTSSTISSFVHRFCGPSSFVSHCRRLKLLASTAVICSEIAILESFGKRLGSMHNLHWHLCRILSPLGHVQRKSNEDGTHDRSFASWTSNCCCVCIANSRWPKANS